MRSPSHSLPSDFLYSFCATLIGFGVLLTTLSLISIFITGPLHASEFLILSLFLIIITKAKDRSPQITSMRTGQSLCNAPVGCPVLPLLLQAMILHKGLKFLEKERLLEKRYLFGALGERSISALEVRAIYIGDVISSSLHNGHCRFSPLLV